MIKSQPNRCEFKTIVDGGEDRRAGSVFRILLAVIVAMFGWSTSACGQFDNRRMIPAQSLKELASEDPTQEGIVQIKIGQLFKEGATEYKPIDRKTLKDAPALPTGFIPFRDLAYRVATKAMVSGEYVISFSLSFTGGAASVELVQPPSATTEGDAMFTVGLNVDDYYRLYVSGGNLFGLKKIGGIKTTLFTTPYDAVNHRFLRIRHEAATNCVILETAPSNGSGPGTWVQRYNQLWNPAVQLANTVFELKGGTWQPETNAAGKVIFDNLLVTK